MVKEPGGALTLPMRRIAPDAQGPGETGETATYPTYAIFVQDWLSSDSHRQRTEVLTWAPIIYRSTATRLPKAKS